jgi:hypothetical protein
MMLQYSMKAVVWSWAFPLLVFAAKHAEAGTYVVTLADMTVFNGVCHGPGCTDDDYITLIVVGPNGQSFAKTFGPNRLHKNDHPSWGLSSTFIEVPGNSQSQLTIEWAAISKGHSANANTVRDAIDAAATAYAEQQQQGQQTGLLDAIVAGVKTAVIWVTQDCDTGLFDQKVTIDGATLSNLAGYDGWQVEPENPAAKWFRVFDYPNIQSSCQIGHYNLKVEIVH